MGFPAAPPPRIRPAIAILLAFFVALFSLLFGFGALYDHEAALAPTVRILMPLALLVVPFAVAVQVRRFGVWMSITAWALASGAALVICAPIAMTANGAVGTSVLLGGIVAMLLIGRSAARARDHGSAPPRVDASP